MDIVTVDIGGTHARFSLARARRGAVALLGESLTLRTADHAGLAAAWRAFAAWLQREPPRLAAVAVAAQVGGTEIQLTNCHWRFSAAALCGELGLDELVLVNDFEAVAHAVGQVPAEQLMHVAGPALPLPERGAITVIGPGTGLGVALLVRGGAGDQVLATEGGHAGFAPGDAFEDRLLQTLRARHGRVSTERVAAGPALAVIHEQLAVDSGVRHAARTDAELWQLALGGSDALASAALERFVAILGSVVGDVALVHGAAGVVLAGGVGQRLANLLPRSEFAARMCAKGRFSADLARIPVKLLLYPQPGLLGAAAAFAAQH